MRLIAIKEMTEYLYNPKFILTFIISFILIVISILNGYTTYSAEMSASASSQLMALEDASGEENFDELGRNGIRVIRQPNKLSIFDIGTSGNIGRKAVVTVNSRPRSTSSRYGNDPVLALFGELDLTFIVSVILSLFAILFSYNSISGERESGTLRQIVANPVKRSSIIIGKLVGGYVPLMLTFLVPFIIGLIILTMIFNVQFSLLEWQRIGLIIILSLGYLLVFFTIGLALSTMTYNSFVSFLMCLFIWVLSVAIIPKVSIHLAHQLTPSYSADDVDSRSLAFQRGTLLEIGKIYKEYFDKTPGASKNFAAEFGNAQNYLIKEMGKRQKQFEDTLFEEISSGRTKLLNTAMAFSRISPSSCFSLAMHSLADTGPDMIDSFENDLVHYRNTFTDFIEMQDPPPPFNVADITERMGIKFEPGPDGSMKLIPITRQAPPKLDLSTVVKFKENPVRIDEMISRIIIDFGIIAFFTILAFSLAFISFLRYDVR